MKILAAVLIVSLAANVVLLAFLLKRDAAAPSAAAIGSGNSPVLTPHLASKPPLADLGHAFADLPPEQLLSKLRSLDLPKHLVDQLVRARILAPLRARSRELALDALKNAPPWKLTRLREDRFALLTPEQRKELRDLEADARNETLRLLGPEILDHDGIIAFKYGFVPPAKAVLLDALVRDYENLGTQLKEETRYLKTPADREREKLLRDEQDRDLAALLSATERDGYEMRASPTALKGNFQSLMRAFQPTEEEYRALFALEKKFDDRLAAGENVPPPVRTTPTGAKMAMVNNAPAVSDSDIRAALGEARFADWQLASQPHYQQLARLAAGTDVAPATIKQVSLLINQTTEASWHIAEDVTLTVPQKKAALAELAATARTQITAQLPANISENFLKNARWLESLATGSAVKIEGTMTSFRAVDPQPPANAASRLSPTR